MTSGDLEQLGQPGSWVEVWIALGSNLADRRADLDGAMAAMRATAGIRITRTSTWIETRPVGGPAGQGPFLNGVACLDTRLGARELLATLQAIEGRFGRERSMIDGPRTLDLDLLLYGEERFDRAELSVPHPRMEERTFVLEPLAQLVPEMRLPVCGETVRARLAALRERSPDNDRQACP